MKLHRRDNRSPILFLSFFFFEGGGLESQMAPFKFISLGPSLVVRFQVSHTTFCKLLALCLSLITMRRKKEKKKNNHWWEFSISALQ